MSATPKGIRARRVTKRVIDTAFIVITAPVTIVAGLITALLVRIFMGSPVFYRQQRIGLNEKTFELLKFRSMLPDADASGTVLSDSERLTRFGTWLRRSSLDELPQLINILRGDMSLVGPRPLLVHYLPFYSDYERARHHVRPGITGAAQVGGRNLLGWDERLAMDAEYSRHATLRDDLRIVFRTIQGVLRSEGVVADESTLIEDLDVYRSYPSHGCYRLRRVEEDKLSPKERLWAETMDDSSIDLLAVTTKEKDELVAIIGVESSPQDHLPLVHIVVNPEQNDLSVEETSLALMLEFMRSRVGFAGVITTIPREKNSSLKVFQEKGFVIIDSDARVLRLELSA